MDDGTSLAIRPIGIIVNVFAFNHIRKNSQGHDNRMNAGFLKGDNRMEQSNGGISRRNFHRECLSRSAWGI